MPKTKTISKKIDEQSKMGSAKKISALKKNENQKPNKKVIKNLFDDKASVNG